MKELENLSKRTIIICSTWIKREEVLKYLISNGIKPIDEINKYQIAPNIDYYPKQKQLQTITKYSFLLTQNSKIDKLHI